MRACSASGLSLLRIGLIQSHRWSPARHRGRKPAAASRQIKPCWLPEIKIGMRIASQFQPKTNSIQQRRHEEDKNSDADGSCHGGREIGIADASIQMVEVR